ncbi:MerC domain-containing protein [Pseudoalteromonas piscicida]|uniref:MerC domain-containing protein n=1 Tax=Pseudoalteromonas piscicida TaxID=43662 RepID=UPI0030ADC096
MRRQILGDKIAIGLSMLCIFHCLILPVLLMALPAMAGFTVLVDESVHQWLLLAVVPLSLSTLLFGCARHKSVKVLIAGGVGISLLLLPWLLGADVVSDIVEVLLTVTGSLTLVYSHFKNYTLRRVTY